MEQKLVFWNECHNGACNDSVMFSKQQLPVKKGTDTHRNPQLLSFAQTISDNPINLEAEWLSTLKISLCAQEEEKAAGSLANTHIYLYEHVSSQSRVWQNLWLNIPGRSGFGINASSNDVRQATKHFWQCENESVDVNERPADEGLQKVERSHGFITVRSLSCHHAYKAHISLRHCWQDNVSCSLAHAETGFVNWEDLTKNQSKVKFSSSIDLVWWTMFTNDVTRKSKGSKGVF